MAAIRSIAAARRCAPGRIVAVKGLGGFHLACDATSRRRRARCAQRKHRDEKPFAVMVRDLDEAERARGADDGGARAAASVERPIVLSAPRDGRPLAPAIAPDATRWSA